MSAQMPEPSTANQIVSLCLSGDVMTGRGIDQILEHSCPPHLFEEFAHSALDYVELAERANGPIGRQADARYIWGDALQVLDRYRPTVRIINLETAVTLAEEAMPDKGIHYRMHPLNVPCLTVARIDCCGLANNHVIDWGYGGLDDTLKVLQAAGIRTAGAGNTNEQAATPAVIPVSTECRVLVFAYGMPTSGIPASWAARADRGGVNLLRECSPQSADTVAAQIAGFKRSGDIVVVSIHWGGNWGYNVGRAERRFAQQLIESGQVHVIYGHSSHHPKGIEILDGKPVLYGCGDLINDYEGISGHAEYRPDLGVLYLVSFEMPSATMRGLRLIPMRRRRFRLNYASAEECRWLETTLSREGATFGTRTNLRPDGTLLVTTQ